MCVCVCMNGVACLCFQGKKACINKQKRNKPKGTCTIINLLNQNVTLPLHAEV